MRSGPAAARGALLAGALLPGALLAALLLAGCGDPAGSGNEQPEAAAPGGQPGGGRGIGEEIGKGAAGSRGGTAPDRPGAPATGPGGDGDGAPAVPPGFEDVAPGGDDGGALVEESPPRPSGGDGTPAAGDGGAPPSSGASATSAVETVVVYLVQPAEPPSASSAGRATAGSGDRRRPDAATVPEFSHTFGCGDRLVGLDLELETPLPVAGTAQHLGLVLAVLLDLEPEEVPGDLMTALRRSPLTVDSVEEVPDRPGTFRVRLAGPLRLGGTCDVPRVRAQLVATARRVEGVEEIEVFIGSEPLDALLSARSSALR